MKSLEEIRLDLLEIRRYYIYKKYIDEVSDKIRNLTALEIVEKYNKIMQTSPINEFIVYSGLYVKCLTQEILSERLGCSPEYLQRQNKRLIAYLETRINGIKSDN